MIQILPEKEQRIWETLLNEEPESYLVGGAVRDIFLDETPKDFDFTTKLRPAEIISLFDDHQVELVGTAFGVVIVDGIEIATFRGDRYFGDGDKDVQITYVDTLEEDLQRRDFTINAMALDVNGKLIDPFHGQYDIEIKQIRFVGDPSERILEDPNRILRAARFAARFGFEIEPDSIAAMQSNANSFSLVASERIGIEIIKVLSSTPTSRIFWEVLRETNILNQFFPELVDCFGFDGGKFHSETVWDHIIETVDGISIKFPIIRLAALLHDIGKPTACKRNEDGSFILHDIIGEKMVGEIIHRLHLGNKISNTIQSLVRNHMRVARYGGETGASMKSFRRTKKIFSDRKIDWKDFIRLRIADHNANESQKKVTFAEIREMVTPWIRSIEPELPLTVTSLVVSGGQLILHFRLTPGPIIGELQRHLLDCVIDRGISFNETESLLIEATEWLARQ